jgi:hypothetical protein
VLHELTLTYDEKPPFVMPPWIAGIHQIRKEACRDIHVDLDSSPPCWNEGQNAFQRTANTPFNSEESMRIDIPKDMIPAELRRIDGVKYFLADKPEFMDMAPIYEVVDKGLAQSKRR